MTMTRKKLEFELGRYQKKVADQQKEIEKLKKQIVGHEDAQAGLFAMIAAVVQRSGEVTITRDEISEIMGEGRHALVSYDAENRAYTLRMPGGEENVEEGREDTSC